MDNTLHLLLKYPVLLGFSITKPHPGLLGFSITQPHPIFFKAKNNKTYTDGIFLFPAAVCLHQP